MSVDIVKARLVRDILRDYNEKQQAQRVEEPANTLPAATAAYVQSVYDFCSVVYARPCLICNQTGMCGHREPEVEIELYAALMRRPIEEKPAEGAA